MAVQFLASLTEWTPVELFKRGKFIVQRDITRIKNRHLHCVTSCPDNKEKFAAVVLNYGLQELTDHHSETFVSIWNRGKNSAFGTKTCQDIFRLIFAI